MPPSGSRWSPGAPAGATASSSQTSRQRQGVGPGHVLLANQAEQLELCLLCLLLDVGAGLVQFVDGGRADRHIAGEAHGRMPLSDLLAAAHNVLLLSLPAEP